jgi:hypothetical protein
MDRCWNEIAAGRWSRPKQQLAFGDQHLHERVSGTAPKARF